MHETIQLVLQYARSAWRFRWWALAGAWGACLLGWVLVAMQPDVYEANARVYVDTSSELRRLLANQIVESDVEDHLLFVREALLGRTQLREVAAKIGLDRDARSEREREALLDVLRREIQIMGNAIDHQGRSDNLYTITYQHSDRAIAEEVVRTLLDSFVENSLGAKKVSSEAAGTFLREQIRDYEQRLREAEERLAAFNRQHFDRLPSMQGGYFQRLQTATEELDTARQSLRLARSRLDRIEQQLRGEAPQVASTGQVDPESIDGRIATNRGRLEELLLRYTDNHPDVNATREILVQLEARRAEQMAEPVDGNARSGASNPVFQALQISRNELEVEIATLQADVSDRETRVARLRGLIHEMPEVEAELARLNRDYDVIHTQYQTLLNSLEREQLSRDVFQSEQIDFRIIDPPAAGNQPVAPKRAVLLILVLMAGFGGAGALAFLLSQIKPVFSTPAEFELQMQLPMLGAVGRCWSPEEQAQRMQGYFYFGAGAASLGLVFIGVFVFETIGPGLRGLI